MEMINHSKPWHCLEIFAFSYLGFIREVLLQTILWSWYFFKLISIFSPMKVRLFSEAIQAAVKLCKKSAPDKIIIENICGSTVLHPLLTESLYGHSGVFLFW